MEPEFLDLEDVLGLHAGALSGWGGADGIRDVGALEAAVAQPQATYDGDFLHGDLFLMAAAYAFHIAQAQAFLRLPPLVLRLLQISEAWKRRRNPVPAPDETSSATA